MTRSTAALLVALTAAASGCGGDAPEAASDTPTEGEPAMSAAAPDALLGSWTFERVRDRPVVDRSPAHILFGAEGRVAGSASCNRMTGSYTVDGETLALSPMAVTRRMCAVEALMEQEARVLAALGEVAGWRIEQGLLVLVDEEGGELFRASRQVEEDGAG